ncbi:MAG: LPS export ABC transporter permease LptG [Alphaproteobacteria bacterium]|nr:LPS export ABC transporter permease LptG [Alphaproteobacteria bacterium]
MATISLKTIWLYVGKQFLLWFLVAFFGLLVLVALIDTVELLRRAAGHQNISAGAIAAMAFLRLPFLAQELTAFAVLFGSILVFVRLTHSHEMVIFRAAGISIWQVLLPALVVAFVFGAVEVTLVNPVSALTLAKYEELEGKYLTGRSSLLTLSTGGSLWLRQVDDQGNQAVIYAERVRPELLELTRVEVTLLDADNKFAGRIDAKQARLGVGSWQLIDVTVAHTGTRPEFHDTYSLPTDLTREKVHESFASPETVSIWELPKFIAALEATGFSALPHRLQWNALLAEPFLLIAMVLIAATVSLRFTRYGGVLILIASGITAAFGVFIFTEIVHALGVGATIPVTLAAWTPSGVTLMLGVSLLLHQEDG